MFNELKKGFTLYWVRILVRNRDVTKFFWTFRGVLDHIATYEGKMIHLDVGYSKAWSLKKAAEQRNDALFSPVLSVHFYKGHGGHERDHMKVVT
jgi:hypothetical protein